MQLEVDKFYSIKWKRPVLFEDRKEKISTVRGVVRRDDLPQPDGERCYDVWDKNGRWTPIVESSIIEAKEIKAFNLPKGVAPSRKMRRKK